MKSEYQRKNSTAGRLVFFNTRRDAATYTLLFGMCRILLGVYFSNRWRVDFRKGRKKHITSACVIFVNKITYLYRPTTTRVFFFLRDCYVTRTHYRKRSTSKFDDVDDNTGNPTINFNKSAIFKLPRSSIYSVVDCSFAPKNRGGEGWTIFKKMYSFIFNRMLILLR